MEIASSVAGRPPRNDNKLVPGEADGAGADVEFSREHVNECFSSFYLHFGRMSGFTVRDNADADRLSVVACSPGRSGSVLPAPSVGGLDEAVATTEAIADDKVTIEVFRVSQACERGELFDVSCVSSAVKDFDAVPMSERLRESGEDGFFDGVEAIVA